MNNISNMIFACAALIASLGVFVMALHSAQAGYGPQVSMGSNPLTNFYLNCSYQSNAVMFQNTSAMDFVITDIVVYNGGASLHTGISTSALTRRFTGGYASYGSNHQGYHFQSGIVVSSGESLYCSAENAYPQITVNGYYAHP